MKKNVGNIILNIQGRRIQTEFATSMNRTSDPAISIYRSRTGNSSTALKFKFAKLNRNINLIGDKNFSLLGIFWRYSKPRLTRFNGTRLLTFILYLKELEFRFNNIGKNIFDLVLLEISKNFKGG
jgi:transposase-like protein